MARLSFYNIVIKVFKSLVLRRRYFGNSYNVPCMHNMRGRAMPAYVILQLLYTKQKGFNDSTSIDYANSVLTDSGGVTFAAVNITI